MVKENIHSEKIIFEYKNSMIPPRAKSYQKSVRQELGAETRKMKGSQMLALIIQNRYHRGRIMKLRLREQFLILPLSTEDPSVDVINVREKRENESLFQNQNSKDNSSLYSKF